MPRNAKWVEVLENLFIPQYANNENADQPAQSASLLFTANII